MGENRISRGMGRIEFVAISEELRKLFTAGYNLRIAYNELKKNKKITMSYSSFCGYAKTMYCDINAPQSVAIKTTTAKHPNDNSKALPPSSSRMDQTIKTKWSDDEVI
jgi:hypothetical protein